VSSTGPDSGAVSPPPLPLHVVEQFAVGLQLRNQGYRGRFAPSPTGPLHAGNLRTALLAWLSARLAGGVILLRIDDLDAPRNRPGAVEALQADLAWLGLTWDGPVELQSRQRGLYATVLSGLRRGGWLYPCRCSRRMLADVSAPHGASPIYPGTFAGSRPIGLPVVGGCPAGGCGCPLGQSAGRSVMPPLAVLTPPPRWGMWCCVGPMAFLPITSPQPWTSCGSASQKWCAGLICGQPPGPRWR